MRHRNVLESALFGAAGDRSCKISRHIRQNIQIERHIQRVSNERYPPARN